MNISMLRTRWAAIGAAVAVTLGAGGIGLVSATSPAGATAYVPITPCRLVDTRPAFAVGGRTAPVGTGDTFTITAHGSNGNCKDGSAIPTTATGLQLNVTGVNASTATFLTIYPTGATRPTSSSLNPVPNAAVPNAVTTGLSTDGKFDVYNQFGSVDVIVDVVGYYTDHQHTGTDIVDETLTGADVQNNTITNLDIQNEPGIADEYDTSGVSLTTTAAAVGGVSMRVPADGFVKVEVTGLYFSGDIGAPADDTFICQIQKGAVTEIDILQPFAQFDDFAATDSGFNTFSMHRILPVAAADNPFAFNVGQSFRVVCDELAGAVVIDNVYVTATYYSSSYEPIGLVVFPSEAEVTEEVPPPGM